MAGFVSAAALARRAQRKDHSGATMTLIDDTFARLMAGGKKAFISVSCVATPGSSCLGRGCGAGLRRPQLPALRPGWR